MSDEIKNQLHTVHNPFSGATSQPKIPDGEMNDSLGYQSQSVFELVNKEDNVSNILHVLLHPGINSCLTALNSNLSLALDQFTAEMPGLGSVNWNDITDLVSDSLVAHSEKFALHRLVSVGAQFKLLNAQDEDDGWWEAVRVNEMFDTEEYRLCTTGTEGDIVNNGTIAPFGVLQNMATREIVNDPTYSTGLLRDLHRVQFELHGIGDEHPFRRMEQNHAMRVGAITGLDKAATYSASFQNDNLQVKEMIRDYQDLSYDMIYLRFHCRGNKSASENLAGSRLHTNLVMNQEVYYETGERDNRYHTKTYSIGASATSLHCQARRASQHAAKLII